MGGQCWQSEVVEVGAGAPPFAPIPSIHTLALILHFSPLISCYKGKVDKTYCANVQRDRCGLNCHQVDVAGAGSAK